MRGNSDWRGISGSEAVNPLDELMALAGSIGRPFAQHSDEEIPVRIFGVQVAKSMGNEIVSDICDNRRLADVGL